MRLLLLLAALSAQELHIPPSRISVVIDNQPLTITTTAILSGSADNFHLKVTADLSDLQDRVTALLQSQLNRSDRCGERLSVERATLLPAPPASLLTAYVHYERWACIKLLGKESAKRLLGGNGTIPVTLTPVLDDTQQVKLTPQVGRIEADGSLGEALQAPAIGDRLRDKIGAAIQSALAQATSLSTTLPAGYEKTSSLRGVRFAGGDANRLLLEVEGEVRLSAGQVRTLRGQ